MIKIFESNADMKNIRCLQILMCPITLTHTVGAPVGSYPVMRGTREVARWLTRKTIRVFRKEALTSVGYDDISFFFMTDSEDEALALLKTIRRAMKKYWDPTKDTDWSDNCAIMGIVLFGEDGFLVDDEYTELEPAVS